MCTFSECYWAFNSRYSQDSKYFSVLFTESLGSILPRNDLPRLSLCWNWRKLIYKIDTGTVVCLDWEHLFKTSLKLFTFLPVLIRWSHSLALATNAQAPVLPSYGPSWTQQPQRHFIKHQGDELRANYMFMEVRIKSSSWSMGTTQYTLIFLHLIPCLFSPFPSLSPGHIKPFHLQVLTSVLLSPWGHLYLYPEGFLTMKLHLDIMSPKMSCLSS